MKQINGIVGEWTPCTEAMPVEPFKCMSGMTMSKRVVVSGVDVEGLDFVAIDYTKDGEWICLKEEYGYTVSAWMPLPKPWEGKEDE